MGGLGDVGSKIDEEVSRTGLLDNEIGPKVHISLSCFLDGLTDFVFKR